MGYDHCAWLADDGSVWTSGDNSKGQLGFGDNTSRNRPSRLANLPPISSVRTGLFATLCLDFKGKLWSFGYNSEGQLGLGDTTDRSSPHMVPGIPSIRSFSIQYRHSVCLCKDESVWSFGHNKHGQLGIEHRTTQSAPVQIPASLFPNDITSVGCGNNHSLFLTCEGQVLACGYNGTGQLGQGDFIKRSAPTLIPNMIECIKISCGGSISCMVDRSHRLWVCGAHTGVQTTPLCFPTIGLMKNISIGYSHSLYINQSGELWGWGNCSFGQFGNGSTAPCTDPIRIKDNIKDCLCLGFSSFIQNTDGEVSCCGKNSNGQFGLGNTEKQLSFIKFLEEEQFRMRFPDGVRKFSQKSARSVFLSNGEELT